MFDIRKIFFNGLRTLAYLGYNGFLVSTVFLVLICFIIVPIPRLILDLLLIFNLVISLILLLRTLSINSPVKLFIFPTFLLFGTLLRLSLNVSSTRLILLNGDQGIEAAGEVIKSFGSFVVQNDFVVGAIVFSLITIINFIVISKGSARVAEVAARFALDSLPGKQIGIDADLKAGNITQEEAINRRETVARESQFYGSMDGAMKFVQGDAIAGLIIVFANSVGGLIIGTRKGMEISEAIDIYGLLAIGDGLVNIVPSLLMSLAAGIVITNTNYNKSKGPSSDIFIQLVAEPRILLLVACSLLILSFIPGLPFLALFLMGVLLIVLGFAMLWVLPSTNLAKFSDNLNLDQEADGSPNKSLLSWSSKKSSLGFDGTAAREDSLAQEEVVVLTIEIDQNHLEPYLKSLNKKGSFISLEETFSKLNDQIYRTRGVTLPRVHIVTKNSLSDFSFQVLVRDKLVKKGKVNINASYVMSSSRILNILGIEVINTEINPYDYRKGFWVNLQNKNEKSLATLGVEIISIELFLAYQVVGAAFEVIEEIIGLNEIKNLINKNKENNFELIQEVFEKELISYAEFTEIIRRLLSENINVRDLKLILETVAEFAAFNTEIKDRQAWINELHHFIRINFSRSLCQSIFNSNKPRVFSLSQEIEDNFREVIEDWSGRKRKPPLEPEFETKLIDVSNKLFSPVLEQGELPLVILSSNDIRLIVQEFYQRRFSSNLVKVLSYQELENFKAPELVAEVGLLK